MMMLGIGVNLKTSNFNQVWELKFKVIIILLLKFFLISIGAFIIAKIFRFNMMETAGIVILGSCPGGTVANIYSYLTRSNLALTVTLTILSTVVAPILIPTMLYLYLHKTIDIPYVDMFLKTVEIVLLPIVVGIVINKYFTRIESIKAIFPSISILCVGLIVSIIVALNYVEIMNFPIVIIIACLFLNLYSIIIAWVISHVIKLDVKASRSVIFEYGMLDSGLATVLSLLFFSPAAALVSTVYSVTQNIIGPIIVKLFKVRDESAYKNSVSN
ncbi:MAG: BASS family bile acid:Na+ symporter [Francisellaceae bacterium]